MPASIGIATAMGGSRTAADLIAEADAAMYRTKMAGKTGRARTTAGI